MWFSLAMIFVAIIGYSSERFSMEITSVILISSLLLFFHFFPLLDETGKIELLTTEKLLLGFANPALISVLALLVIGQAVIQTGALNEVSNIILRISRNNAVISVGISLLFVMVVSAFLNNTPVVVIFIPIMAALARSVGISASKVMIPLSFASILGGMLTLVGSSTNLLVSGILIEMEQEPLGFFDFTIPGMVMASVGLIYVVFILPKILPDRASLVKDYTGEDDKRQFIAQIEIDYSSDFVGKKLESDSFEGFPDVSVRMIQRGEHAFLPPFDDTIIIRPRDIIIMGAPRKELMNFFSQNPDSIEKHIASDSEDDFDVEVDADMTIAEIVITPASKMVGKTLEQAGFYGEYECTALGIQRQSRMIRAKVTEIRLAAGDVLLVMGKMEYVLKLHESSDFLLMEWSAEDLHPGSKATLTGLIFGAVVGFAAVGFIPITITAFVGAALIIATGCLNIRQAGRSLDLNIVLMIAASLALGYSLQATGGASFLANLLIYAMQGASPLMVMSALFLLMVVITNILSNNAAAVLFTPIAVNLAVQLGVDPMMFIFAVIFACNCSFVTPIGYQTNLMVMGPGHHKFVDFIRTGVPLALIIWISYTIFAYLYF